MWAGGLHAQASPLSLWNSVEELVRCHWNEGPDLNWVQVCPAGVQHSLPDAAATHVGLVQSIPGPKQSSSCGQGRSGWCSQIQAVSWHAAQDGATPTLLEPDKWRRGTGSPFDIVQARRANAMP